MKTNALLPLALIAGALWILFRSRGEASALSSVPYNVTTGGPTFNSDLGLSAALEALAKSTESGAFGVDIQTADMILGYQKTTGRPIVSNFEQRKLIPTGTSFVNMWQSSFLPNDWLTALQLEEGFQYKEIGRGTLMDGSKIPIFQKVKTTP